MANPAAPTESGGLSLAFLLGDDQGGGNEAVLPEALGSRSAIIESSTDKAAPTVVQQKAEDGQLIALAAYTTSQQSADQVNHGWKGVAIFVECTAIVTTPVVTVIIEAKDPVSGAYFPIATFTNTIVAISSRIFMLYPGLAESIAETDLEIQALPLPTQWRLNLSHVDADSATYSVGFAYLP